MATSDDLSSYDDNFVGVVPIKRPAGRAKGRIFAFHGLGGGWKSTWSAHHTIVSDSALPDSTRSTKSIFWLQDLLPRKFPECAIYSVGHKNNEWYARPSGFHGTIANHLKSTPFDERAPIVFVTHSLGGVYLKSLIQFLWGDGELKSCTPQLDQLQGVIFLATPQHLQDKKPSDYKSFASKRTRESLFKDENVDEWRHRLNCITDEFKKLVESKHLKIISVYEASSQIVQKDETKLGVLPDNLETIVDGSATHFLLPKFWDHNERRFQEMCGWLRTILGNLHKPDTTWDPMTFPLQSQRPFGELQMPSKADIFNLKKTKPLFPGINDPGHTEFWVHLPANNELWMTNTIGRCFPGIEDVDNLKSNYRRKPDFPHSRYVLPHNRLYQSKAEFENLGYKFRTTRVYIFLPYLHWDTVGSNKTYKNHVLHKCSSGNDSSFEQTPSLVGLLEQSPEFYHPRRTLDQYYYPWLKDTRKRDTDQVVSRQTRIKDKSSNVSILPKIIMVDQLWLCLRIVERTKKEKKNEKKKKHRDDRSKETLQAEELGYGSPTLGKNGDGHSRETLPPEEWEYVSSLLITSFPHTSYPRLGDDSSDLFRTADVRQSVFESLEGKASKDKKNMTAYEFAPSILSIALLSMLSVRQDWSLDFLELFRDAIGDATEKYNQSYREFEKLMISNGESSELKEKKTEIRLGLRITDIIKELYMLQQLFEIQQTVLNKKYDYKKFSVTYLKSLEDEMSRISTKITTSYLNEIKRMIKESERLQRNLLDLLELQQKEESLREMQLINQQALFAAKQALLVQDGADATQAQSQIVFVFTLVTIVFLPLSFFSSLFGMNIDDGNNDAVNYGRTYVNKIMFGGTGGIFGLFMISALMLYFWGKRVFLKKRIEELLKLEARGNLPKGLITEEDPEYPLMKKMRKERKRQDRTHLKAEEIVEAPNSHGGFQACGILRRRKSKPEHEAV